MMRDMEQLPPDQRAVLSLVLTQGKSYGEVASMLRMPEQAVRERAHAALDSLSAQGAPAPAEALATLAQPQARRSAPPARGGSRTGGAILLGLIVVAVAVAAIVMSSGGKGSGGTASQQAATNRTASRQAQRTGNRAGAPTASSQRSGAGAGAAGGVRLDKRFALTPADPASKARGEGIVVSEGKKRAFYVTAQGLPASSGFFYAVWLYDSQAESWPLGRTEVGSNGLLEGGGPLAAPHLARFHRLVITRETNPHPGAPGEIVLSGPFALR